MKTARTDGRIDSIDVMKALGILLVIAGHSVTNGFLRGPIFAFHMPMFFIASGMTYRFSKNRQEFFQKKKNAMKKLLLPAAGLFSVHRLLACVVQGDPFRLYDFLLALFYGSGVTVHLPEKTIPAVGAVWFLLALFFVRVMGDLLHLCTGNSMIKCVGGGTLLSVLGVLLGQKEWLPFSFDVSLAATSFFIFGAYLSRYDLVRKLMNAKRRVAVGMFLVGGAALAVTYAVKRNYLELASREYPLFPVCYLIAALWTLALLNGSQRLLRWRRLAEHLLFIGRNTMILFGIHYMDTIWSRLWHVTAFGSTVNELLSALLRTAIDVALLYILCFGKSRMVRKAAAG